MKVLCQWSHLLLITVLVSLVACGSQPDVVKFSGSVMGTTYHVTVVPDQPVPPDLEQRIAEKLARVDQLMSTYKNDSQLSQFNRVAVGEKFDVATDILNVLSISRDVWKLSGGALDPTVGPLVDLWGFGAVPKQDVVPTDTAITTTLNNIGFEHVLIYGSSVSKKHPVQLDLSAVAKGYAVDLVADFLEMSALPDYLVEVGGEIRVSGTHRDGKPWRIAIEQPSLMSQVHRVLPLHSMAVATSGDYRNYFEAQGVRYSHTIDPRTGKPVEHDLASATVLAPSCAEADAWATAFMVLGEQDGLALANRLDIPLYMMVRDGDTYRAVNSRSFQPYLVMTAEADENILLES